MKSDVFTNAKEKHDVGRWSQANCSGTTRPVGEVKGREEIGLTQ
jgi:hypothetical protein